MESFGISWQDEVESMELKFQMIQQSLDVNLN